MFGPEKKEEKMETWIDPQPGHSLPDLLSIDHLSVVHTQGHTHTHGQMDIKTRAQWS